MATWRDLPAISVTAVVDTTGDNSGNYTNWFSSDVLGRALKVPYAEWYHASVQSAPGGSAATIFRNANQFWGFVAPGIGAGSEYSPGGGGMIVHPGDEIMFFWNIGTGSKPIVTLWFRYDIDDPANAANA